jgi:hypothetical protein
MNTDQILTVKYNSNRLADHAVVAHFTELNENALRWHIKEMHHHFLKIADVMGYDVNLRTAECIIDDEAA